MINKKVCPNCGQLYDPELPKCPLCGQAPQVVDTDKPVQRHRITEAERRQRRAERRDAELEARRRRKDEQLARDAEEERLLEEEEALRREERRRIKEEKKAQRLQQKQAASGQNREMTGEEIAVPARMAQEKTAQQPEEPAVKERMRQTPAPEPVPTPVVTPAPARTKQRPEMQEKAVIRDRGRVPRAFLVLCVVLLTATLMVGTSYLLWKLGTVRLPIYDKLAASKDQTKETAAAHADNSEKPEETKVKCRALSISVSTYEFTQEGDTIQISAKTEPAGLVESYTSSDESVVVVGEAGLVTAVGPGTATITVSCGDKTVECLISCKWEKVETTLPPDLPEGDIELEMEDMSFKAKGESYVQTVKGLAPGTPVIWSSADESVATVDAGGHIFAVGPGTTTVTATVGNSSASCWVRCNFEAEEDGGDE